MSKATAPFLLRGSFYALEQCGHLLRSAYILLNQGEFPSSVALTAFAREELGRSRILYKYAEKIAVSKELVTMKQVTADCEDHFKKQYWAQVLPIIMGRGNDTVSQLLSITRSGDPNGPEGSRYRDARAKLESIAAARAKRAPNDRHDKRLKALYVEPNQSGSSWNRPCTQFKSLETADFLFDAINDYLRIVSYVEREVINAKNNPMSALIKAWPDRPLMPEPFPKAKVSDP